MIRAVLFDLDDTLFDHRHCAASALETLREDHACFSAVPAPELQRRHGEVLEELHLRVVDGTLALDDARRERFRRLFVAAGLDAPDDLVAATAERYKRRYIESWREVPGATALLDALRGRVRIGIVSNNLQREQEAKLRFCGFDARVDAVVISEGAGVSKPDPAIFHMALRALECEADEAVMVGDAWRTDIAGALAAGIRPVWFNPAGTPRPETAPDVQEVRTLAPPDAMLDAVFEPRRAGRP